MSLARTVLFEPYRPRSSKASISKLAQVDGVSTKLYEDGGTLQSQSLIRPPDGLDCRLSINLRKLML